MRRQQAAAHRGFADRYGEWAIVTGASSGIGEAFAHAVAARGIRPLLVARREDELRRVAADVLGQTGMPCECLALDLADPGFADRLRDACAGRDVGLIVANAGFNPPGAFLGTPRETLMRMFDVNARANLLLAEAFLPGLKARGRGGLLLVGSVEGFFGFPYSACYSATKAFVLSFGEALWGEMRPAGVDVLVLAPGATDTPLLASRDLGSAKVGMMAPAAVANIGLDHLGCGPCVVPGALNRWMFRFLRRLPRRWSVPLVGAAMRRVVLGQRSG